MGMLQPRQYGVLVRTSQRANRKNSRNKLVKLRVCGKPADDTMGTKELVQHYQGKRQTLFFSSHQKDERPIDVTD